jgi:predicted transcriptional regulator
MDNQQRAWKLSVAGCSKHQIAEQLGVSGRTIQRYIDRQLTANSSFPSDLEPAEVNKVRQVQSEILLAAMARVIRQMHRVEADEKASSTDKLFALSAATRALGAANARLARMNSLDVPLRIQEESMRVQLLKVDGKIKVEFDREQLRPKWTPLGLRDCNGHPYERLADRVVDHNDNCEENRHE